MSEQRPYEVVFKEICAMEAPLRERLSAFADALSEHDWGHDFAAAYEQLVGQLKAADAGSAAPIAGELMPPFLLPDADGHLRTLEEILDVGPAIISFNRGHWCEFCELELQSFASAQIEFARRGARCVSIMPERRIYLLRARERTGDAILYLGDIDNAYALELGLTIWLGDAIRDLYQSHGMDVEEFQGSQSWFVPIPATFVVGRDGRIYARKVDPDFRRRMDLDEILAGLDAAREAEV